MAAAKPSWIRRVFLKKILALVLAFVVFNALLFPIIPVAPEGAITSWLIPVAQADDAVSLFTALLERTGIYRRPQRGTPPTGRRSGGAGRGPICALAESPQDEANGMGRSVTALMATQPQNESAPDMEMVGGLTFEENPVFWFYLPYVLPLGSLTEASESSPASSPNRVAQFVLLDEAEQVVWQELMLVELREMPRLVEYSLPYPLEVNELYNWYFSVICDSDKLSRNSTVRGWVQRVESSEDVQTTLSQAAPLQQYLIYAEQGIWIDMVNSLVELRRQFNYIGRDVWANLLSHLNLPDLDPLYALDAVEPSEREVVNGNQLPLRM
jgi:hypothetical protein